MLLVLLLSIRVHLAGLNFAITSSKIDGILKISAPYQSYDSYMYHKQSMEIIIRALTYFRQQSECEWTIATYVYTVEPLYKDTPELGHFCDQETFICTFFSLTVTSL